MLAGTLSRFGLAVHAIVGVAWPRGTEGREIDVGGDGRSRRAAMLAIRLPTRRTSRVGQYAFDRASIALVLA